jgi:hypothetical protein
MHARRELLRLHLLGGSGAGCRRKCSLGALTRAFSLTLGDCVGPIGGSRLLPSAFLGLLSLVVELGEKPPSCHFNPPLVRYAGELSGAVILLAPVRE